MNLSKYPTKDNQIPVLSRKDLSAIAMDVLSEHAKETLSSPQPTDIEALIEDEFYLDIKRESIFRQEKPVIGMCAFFDASIRIPSDDPSGYSVVLELQEGNIVIEESLERLKKYHRARNTMAHELSHWILHRAYFTGAKGQLSFRKQPAIACRDEAVSGTEKKAYGFYTDLDWLEFQANCMGAALLMPEKTFRQAFLEECQDNHLGRDYLIAGQDLIAENLIVRSLMNVFCVSRQSAAIRLKELGLLVYANA